MLFSSGLNEISLNEAWGICDLNLWFNYCPLDSWNDESICVVDCPPGTLSDRPSRSCIPCLSTICLYEVMNVFNCSNPQRADTWNYHTSYDTIKFNNTNYMGPYGKDGFISIHLPVAIVHQ